MKTLKHILVLGKDGQVGQAVLSEFSSFPVFSVHAYGRQDCDIINKQQVSTVIAQVNPDIVINCAAYTQVDFAEDNEVLAAQINAAGPSNIAQACAEYDAFLIHISTDYVFDGHSDRTYIEDDIPHPQSAYGRTKLLGEQAVLAHCPQSIILRTSWVFSAESGNFLTTMLKLAQSHSDLNIVDDQFGGPTVARDIALAILTVCQRYAESSEQSEQSEMRTGIYHFSGYPYVSWYEFADFIFTQLANFEKVPVVTPIPSSDYPQKATRPLNSCLSNHKISEHFAIHASDWRAAVTQIIQDKYKG